MTLVEYISTTNLIWLIITIGVFQIGIILYERSSKALLLQPIFLTYIVVLLLLLVSDTRYEHYYKSVELIDFLLGPATVALAIPLYHNLKLIKKLFLPVVMTLIIGSSVSIILGCGLLFIFGASSEVILSMTTKSITAAIAIITSEQIGAVPSLAVSFVIITGITGAVFGTLVFKIFKIKYDESKGFALGIVSHGIGTSRAIEISEKAGAFSALAMGLGGIFVSIILPIVIHFID
jgi:predicted murein hydrolase (TIGR00659 family)